MKFIVAFVFIAVGLAWAEHVCFPEIFTIESALYYTKSKDYVHEKRWFDFNLQKERIDYDIAHRKDKVEKTSLLLDYNKSK